MKRENSFFKQKQLWIGSIAIVAVLTVISLAMMGSTAGAKLQSLPVAIVVTDQPVDQANGEKFMVGDMLKSALLAHTQTIIHWHPLESESKALQGLDRQDYYAALILPSNLSSGVLTLASPNPSPGVIQLYINEGKNVQVSSAISSMLQLALQNNSIKLSKQLLTDIKPIASQSSKDLSLFLEPFTIQTQTVHPMGPNSGNGNVPMALTQIIWISCLITSISMFLTSLECLKKKAPRQQVLIMQMVVGLVWVMVISLYLLWMTTAWYRIEVYHFGKTWLFLLFSYTVFFLLQSALLNWLGFPAVALCVLMFFFSMPIINVAPEMLPQGARDWIYSWTPFRFVSAGLKSVMYFDGANMSITNRVLGWVAGICLLLNALSLLKKKPAKKPKMTSQ